MGAFSIFNHGPSAKKTQMIRARSRDSLPSEVSDDQPAQSESDSPVVTEVQWLRKMIDKEKAEKEWIMARYEVAEFYLKAKDEEIQRLRLEMQKVTAATHQTYPRLFGQDAMIVPSSQKSPLPLGFQEDQKCGQSLGDRRGIRLSMNIGNQANKQPGTSTHVAAEEESPPTFDPVQTLPGVPLPVLPVAAEKPATHSKSSSNPTPLRQFREASPLLTRRRSAPCMPVQNKGELKVDTKDKLVDSGAPASPKRKVTKSGCVQRRIAAEERHRRASFPSTDCTELSVEVSKSQWLDSPESPKRTSKSGAWK
eukprot:TRINITY_DN11583_c0_g2_i1.p1 TRINITY_DN11583_c0_g2~~TRINITY_DN11583_c0_g2_i1.p1  ORF type:complete len:309 (+),score=69.10 TRINITY_DN11583_c0_g2_i1:80-1006(+)